MKNLYRLDFNYSYTHKESIEFVAENHDDAVAISIGKLSRYPIVENELLVCLGPVIQLPKPKNES